MPHLESERRVFGRGRIIAWLILSLALAATLRLASAAERSAPVKKVDYNRDVRPILSENCYACHGPDQDKRKAGLRLDRREDAFQALKSSGFAIVPGHPDKSELMHRITTADEDDRMPPVKSGKKLTSEQVDLLQHWIEQGAPWTGHWAYLKPGLVPVPEVQDKGWPRNEIDNFVLARLENQKLRPAPEAEKTRLIRRVSLDLTGLPPSVSEVEDFLYDNNPASYEKLVDRLLKSPAYGERMAQDWLDLARYADSQGYHHDSHRDVWPWRDWVINAFNRNMPFDQFTVEQLAGDLLPNPTREQRIATGFHRNEMTTSEGGAMPEEYAVKYVAGRVDTTARVWLGTSLACAECHDHKYDPISQKDYYKFFAYFNTIGENGLDQELNPAPRLVLDTPEQRARTEQFTKEIAALEKARESLIQVGSEEWASGQTRWANRLREAGIDTWKVAEAVQLSSRYGATLSKEVDGSVRVTGVEPDKDVYEITVKTDLQDIKGLRLEALVDESLPKARAGRSASGDFVLSRLEAVARSLRPEQAAPVPVPELGRWYSLGPLKAGSAREAFDKNFGPENGVDLAQRFQEGKIPWTEQPNWKDGENHLLAGENAATYLYRTLHSKTSGWATLSLGSPDGLQVWWNGRKLLARDGSRELAPDQNRIMVRLVPGENRLLLKVSRGAGASGFNFKWLSDPVLEHPVEFAAAAADFNQADFHVRGTLDEKSESGWAVGGESPEAEGNHQGFYRTYDAFGFPEGTEITIRLRFESAKPRHTLGRFRLALGTAKDLGEWMSLPDKMRANLLRDPSQLSSAQKLELQRYYRETFVPEVQELGKLLDNQRKAKQEFQNGVTVTMVMQEMEKPRDSFLLVRGNFQLHGEKVTPGVPASLFPMPPEYPANRLGLAKWLTHPDHPLVSRVTVNHYWQHYFGNGLVKTAEDFGSQGEWPSHPELLDWLATQFIASKWNVKALQRLIVTSATYRQAVRLTPEMLQADPDDRWLARFPRLRLDAEAIRDNALAVSGLLNGKVGGPSAYPYQPPGLWEAVAFEGTRKYEQSVGAENYRRGLYTYWRRSLPYPSLITFDAPTRETCTVRRPKTNTPLQALTLMNDPVYVEASRAFGQRIMREGGATIEARLNYAFRVCLGRPPAAAERAVLESAFRKHMETFEQNRVSAAKLIHVGASSPPLDLDPCELAAWTLIGTTLLNLDETITKG